jgi:hypothetical protein
MKLKYRTVEDQKNTIKLVREISSDFAGLPCPKCNGYADRVKLTEIEIQNQDCRRDYECCGRAFICRLCKTRIVGNVEAPDVSFW